MKRKFKQILTDFSHAMEFHKTIFFISLMTSIILIVAGFLLPPKGQIDNSVLVSVGELFAFAALASGIKAVENGKEVQVKHKDTEITFGDINHEDSNDNNYGSTDYWDYSDGGDTCHHHHLDE